MSRNPGTGVYTLPSGTLGTPNTTIASAKYNAFAGDIEQDLNTARPISSGGTGATNATAARANLGTDNASNLTSGTVADARLPTTQAGKTFTTAVTVSTDATGSTVIDQKSIELFWTSGPYIDFKNAAVDDSDARIQLTGGNTLTFTTTANLLHNGNTIWTSGNDGAGSGMDADLLDGQQGAYYQNSSNQNAGTLADARLPSSMANKTFTGTATVTGVFHVAAAGNNTVEIGRVDGVASIATIDFHTGATAVDFDTRIETTGGTGVDAGGTMNFLAANLNHGGQKVWDAGNDGAGSGLDADVLDGQQGSYYADVPARLGFTPVRQGGPLSGGGSNAIWIGWGGDSTLRLQVDSTSFTSTWPINIGGSAASLGGLAASQYARVAYSTNNLETDYPLGTYLVAFGGTVPRNNDRSLRLDTANNAFRSDATGTLMSGTWRAKGYVSSDGGGNYLFQRVG